MFTCFCGDECSGSCKTVSEWKSMTGWTSAKPATRVSFLLLWTVCSLGGRCVSTTLYLMCVCVCVCSQRIWSVLESHARLCPSPTAHLIQFWPAVTRRLLDAARRSLLSAHVIAVRLLRPAKTGVGQCCWRRAPEHRETAATPTRAREVKTTWEMFVLRAWRKNTAYINTKVCL